MLAVTTVGFDIAALELYGPLLSGASVAVSPAETVKDVAALTGLIETSAATVMQATPTLWQALASHSGETASDVGRAASHGGALAGMRMLVGGEALSAGLAGALLGSGGVWRTWTARPRRRCGLRRCGATALRARPRLRSAPRSGTRGFMFWTGGLSLSRLVLRESFTSRVLVLRAGIWAGLG